MHQAARLQFERFVDEFARWRAVPESENDRAVGSVKVRAIASSGSVRMGSC